MAAQLRAVRQRIRSIQSTAKITRAQEMIAASRIIKAQQRVQASRPW
jgi:F-type H+-transporting ATPase subunit gamma